MLRAIALLLAVGRFPSERHLSANPNFDALRRIAKESDQFFDGTGGGNMIRYFYDDRGRLGTFVDPVGRGSKLYEPVLLRRSRPLNTHTTSPHDS